MNRTPVVLLVAFLTLAPLAAQNSAQNSWEVLIRRFELSEDEVTALRYCRAQIRPLQGELRPLLGLSRELLAAEVPNPTAIGEHQLRIHFLREQIRAAERECTMLFEGGLTDVEMEELERIRRVAQSARRNQRIISALRNLGLLGGYR